MNAENADNKNNNDSNDDPKETIRSSFWHEQAEPDNPFAAAVCRCAGFDVYGDLLGKASWIEYLYLLFQGEQPDAAQTKLLNGLAVAIANPGPRDYSVHAAMAAGAGGSTLASNLMAALAVGAGRLGGAREVCEAMGLWEQCGRDLNTWQRALEQYRNARQTVTADIWPAAQHPPGFDPRGISCPTPIRQTLTQLADNNVAIHLQWLQEHRSDMEAAAALPLAISGVAAAAFMDLGFDHQQGEMLYLLLRLPGAAAHALDQHGQSRRTFPFFRNGINLQNDPGPKRGSP
ncbi:citryl-CoA lyase [Exilibacterium tricleocarpae]|uniref:Citryl-CoA lyase n=1 Tax=Exilibacterium tricleocarpae TaxID=2591008 RepID=A0A545U8B6_9GAMM|nr:citryl-CoA lyase [Exilibacterium tricleocarpae]TQV85699.1 citryl-CoA lyase [Exilibacterium tricleocarpae]